MTKLIAALGALSLVAFSINAQEKLKQEPYQLMNSIDLTGEKISGQIVIAVIDDGFLLDHKELIDFWWRNEKEIPNNGIDDDGNGFIDDITGWDIVDGDNNVVPNKENLRAYYHGTATASIIIQMVQKAYGNTTAERVKIIPIKAVSDNATRLTLENGYQGLDYAIANNADIICMAWNGGEIEADEAKRIQEAKAKGILMLASAGNNYSDKISPPASLADVYCIGAIDSNYRKYPNSNYGVDVDLVAFGSGMRAAHSDAPNAYFNAVATSSAVAQVCGVAAILKIHKAKATSFEIMEALINTAIPLDNLNPRYMAKLGAGLPNIKDALDYLDNPKARSTYFNPERGKGTLYLTNNEISIEANQAIQNIRLTPIFQSLPNSNCSVQFLSLSELVADKNLKDWTSEILIPGNNINLVFEACKRLNNFKVEYQFIPIDSSALFCKELKIINDTSGYISDGSGDFDYANNVSCKWQIVTTEQKHLKISFEEIAIHPSDEILLFYGDHMLQENLVAKFSGSTIPPEIITASSRVTLWFITDATKTAAGWKIKFETTTKEPGILQH